MTCKSLAQSEWGTQSGMHLTEFEDCQTQATTRTLEESQLDDPVVERVHGFSYSSSGNAEAVHPL